MIVSLQQKRKSDIFSAILYCFCFLLAIALFRFVQGIISFFNLRLFMSLLQSGKVLMPLGKVG